MWWTRQGRTARVEDALARLRVQLLSSAPVSPVAGHAEAARSDELRLFPIVGPDLCFPVAGMLARGKLEEASRLVSERAWVASVPLYG
jgi:hypothetical protein